LADDTELSPLMPPEIGPLRAGNTGVDYVTSFDSGVAGPRVVINGLIHGNELCGAVAITTLLALGVRPRRGRLTLALANVAAFHSYDPGRPQLARYLDDDMNRLWQTERLEGPLNYRELRRARQLRPIYDQAEVLLDLHSMHCPSEPLILTGTTARSVALARRLGYPAWIISDAGHAAGRRLIDYQPFVIPGGTATALLVECGPHQDPASAQVALEVSLRLLVALGLVEPAWAAPWLVQPSGPQRHITVTEAVTATSDQVEFVSEFSGMAAIPRAGTVIACDRGRPIATPYDQCFLIMPARSARKGQTVVRFGRLTS